MLQAKQSIAVDLCNTVCDINTPLEKIFHKRLPGTYYIPGVTEDFFIKNTDIFRTALAFTYAAECLHLLAKHYNIIYVTARPIEAAEATEDFLKENDFPKGQIIFSKNKAVVFKKLSMVFAIDDSPSEIINYQKSNIPVLIKAWDYNHGLGVRFEWKYMYHFLCNNYTNKYTL